jgi:hypothetical protein
MATEPRLSPATAVLTVSSPAAKSTLVFSATFTSDLLALLTGSTSTTVAPDTTADVKPP